MSDNGVADCRQDIKSAYADGDSVQEGPSAVQEDSKAENDIGETSGAGGTPGGDSKTEASLDEMVEELTAEVEAFREATDDLETMSESVQCLLRTAVTGDGRPVGVWKDVC
ncbi:hypothetical protein GCK32_002421 [Trichostrongylus colubriformis]|uniref:Uncharacterized protein n=1 Tax=Trichostrongylus colubriformis TaxID=6319 RepID=A0AAN8GCE6_TRICO